MSGASLPFGGDLNAAMRAQDRAAIRVLMEHRDSMAAGGSAAAAGVARPPAPAPAPSAARSTLAGTGAAPEPSGSGDTASFPAVAVCDGPLVNVKVKFGKVVVPLTINVGAGVLPILQQLAGVTKVPASSQTLLGPGGRKWTAGSDLSTLGVKEGMKLTLIGKVPPGWRTLEALEKGKPHRQLWPQNSSAGSVHPRNATAKDSLTRRIGSPSFLRGCSCRAAR
jgi:hypothetical protein